MKNVLLKSSLGLLLSSFSLAAFAAAPSLRIPAQIVGSRPAGLGGAFTAVADDQNALFYNPAGLSYLDSTFFGLLEGTVSVSVGSGGIGATLEDFDNIAPLFREFVNSSGDVPKLVDNAVKFGELVSSRTVAGGGQVQSYLARPRWGYALTGGFDLGFGLHSKVLPEVADAGVVSEVDLRGGYAHKFLNGKASIGAVPYYRLRAQGGRANFSLTEVSELDKTVKNTVSVGQGFGLDLGLMVKPIEAMSPTFGLAILNVGDTKFYKASFLENSGSNKDADVLGTPDSVKQMVNVGFSVSPIDGAGFVRISGELREINRPTPAELKPAFGVEAGFRSRFIRTLVDAGWGNNNWSAGVEIRSFVKLRLATYVEPDLFFDRKENQRVWMVSLGL